MATDLRMKCCFAEIADFACNSATFLDFFENGCFPLAASNSLVVNSHKKHSSYDNHTTNRGFITADEAPPF